MSSKLSSAGKPSQRPTNSGPKRAVGWRSALRLLLALAGLFSCVLLITYAARTGVSRLLQTSSIIQSRIEPVDIAVKMTPNDPEAHYTRALSLVNLERLTEAVAELNQATRLRPHHYYQWMDLGVTLDRVGDQAGAVAALRESVRLAPFYAQPHWQLNSRTRCAWSRNNPRHRTAL